MPTNNQHKNNQNRQVNLAQKAGVKGTSATRDVAKNGTKSKYTKKNKVIITILVLIIIAVIVFLVLGGRYVYATIMPQKETKAANPILHQITPEADQEKVAYYILGLQGKENNSPTEMMSILCYDKEKKVVNILQIPQDTYIGDSEKWTVKRISEVWGNPKPLDWCTTCRRSVAASEISNGKHTVCNTTITQMTGSSAEDLCTVFNVQYGLPVDATILFPQATLVKLVNLLGGIDVNLEASMKVNDIQYNSGVQTLDGDAALYYATNRGKGISGDIDLLVKQRKVFLALFQRLARQSEDKLTKDTIGPLMNGSTPIKLSGPSKDNVTFNRTDLIKLILDMNTIKPASMTAYVIPGESAKKSGTTYYSVHKADLLALLNQSFHPVGEALTDNKLGLTEISTKEKSDLHKQVLSEVEAAQSGAMATTAASETTTANK